MTAPRVLFVCVENSCRSQMAEAFGRLAGLDAHSAGSRPSGRVHPGAVASLAELGCDLGAHTSKGLPAFAGRPFDVAITMGCRDACPPTHALRHEEWDIPDPKALGPAGFRQVREQIARRVETLATSLGATAAQEPSSLQALVRRHARRRPEEAALEIDARSVSWRMLDADADRAACWLLGHGVQPGERVVLRLPKGLAFVRLFLGALRLGAVVVAGNERAPDAELSALLASAEPRLVVVAPGRLPPRDGLPAGATWLEVEVDDDLADQRGDLSLPLPPDPRALACLLYTSGTTGAPKGVRLLGSNLEHNAAALAQVWGLCERDRLLHVLPLFHVHGLFVALGAALSAGAWTLLRRSFEPARCWEDLARRAITVFMGVPTMYHRLLEQAPSPPPIVSHVRLFLSGSAPLSPRLAADFAARTGRPLVERYGLSETLIATSQPQKGGTPGSVGRPLPGVRLRVVDPASLSPVAAGSSGEVQLTGPSVCDGYWRDPAATRAAFSEGGWFATGDLGFLDADGSLHLTGRKKDLVISGGFNVAPREVEAVLEEHPDVAECAVVGLPDEDLGEVPAAALVLAPGARLDEDALASHCKLQLAAYKCPRRFVTLPALPRNPLGKLQRNELLRFFSP